MIDQLDREMAKYEFTFIDSEGNDAYTFSYKPYVWDKDRSDNIEFVNAKELVSLMQARTADLYPVLTESGENAEWINFRIYLESDGSIRVLIDGTEHMLFTDSSFSRFSSVRFTYRTGLGSNCYMVQVKDLSVLPY